MKLSLTDESTLLREFANGSREAFTLLFNRFYPVVFYYVKGKVTDPDSANDITAECFIKFWKTGKRDFDSLGGVHAYLLRAAMNASINAGRDQKTKITHQTEINYHLPQSTEPQENEEDQYRAELMRLVLDEIERLPKKRREIFKLAYIEGLKNEEISKLLNLSNKTVRNQKNRALTQLRIALLDKVVTLPLPFILYLLQKQ